MNKKLKKSEKFAFLFANALHAKVVGSFIAAENPIKGAKLKETTKAAITAWMGEKFDAVWWDVMQEVHSAINRDDIAEKAIKDKGKKTKKKVKVEKKKVELVNLANTGTWSEESKPEKKSKKTTKATKKVAKKSSKKTK